MWQTGEGTHVLQIHKDTVGLITAIIQFFFTLLTMLDQFFQWTRWQLFKFLLQICSSTLTPSPDGHSFAVVIIGWWADLIDVSTILVENQLLEVLHQRVYDRSAACITAFCSLKELNIYCQSLVLIRQSAFNNSYINRLKFSSNHFDAFAFPTKPT